MVETKTKHCAKHGETEYGHYNNGNGKKVWRCKKCNVDAVTRKRYKLKEKAVEYLGGKCIVCGYNNCLAALEFHHPDKNKEFGIAHKGYTRSWEKVKAELDKCVLVCSNHHKEIEAGIIDIENIIPR